MLTPRIEIDLKKIGHNTKSLIDIYGLKGISLIGVTKAVNGDSNIAKVLVKSGIKILADSRISNIIKMRKAGVKAQFLLLRIPFLSQAKETVESTDISLNSEIIVIQNLSKFALISNKKHKIILMMELGDLREGVMPADIEDTVEQILKLKGIELIGIAANLACFIGVKPTNENMSFFSKIVQKVELKFGIKLQFISAGNSANYEWFKNVIKIKPINNLRIGESIYLGRDVPYRNPIPGLFLNAFKLVSEVIEYKTKPSISQCNSFKNSLNPNSKSMKQGMMKRAILGIGIQDVAVTGLKPIAAIKILGASSDHLMVDSKKVNLKVGKELSFNMNYSALLSAMNSPHIIKRYINL